VFCFVQSFGASSTAENVVLICVLSSACRHFVWPHANQLSGREFGRKPDAAHTQRSQGDGLMSHQFLGIAV